MRFIRSVLRSDVTESDGTITLDLPVNPISHIVYTVKVLNSAVNTKATLAQILGGIEKVEVLYKGSAILSMSGPDLYALNCVLLGREPWQENVINTNDATRMLTLVIPFGTKLFDPTRCLFPTRKGELQLKLTLDVADAGYDGMISQIETVEMPGAAAPEHLRVTTLNLTPVSGDNDLDLPIGNKYLAMLLYATTVPTATVWTKTINNLKLLIGNVEAYYAKTLWESLHGDLINVLAPANAWGEKFHLENTASAYTQNADTATEEQADTALAHYALLDFGLWVPKDFILDSKGLSRLHLKINAGDTNAIRVLPIELAKMA